MKHPPERRSAPLPGRARRGARRPRPPKLYRIGEVVAYSGLSRQTVHNYTTMGMLREARWTAGGHRLYDEAVFERLDEIADLKSAGRSLQEIREHFARIDARGR
ncbi:MAG TPA: MerR family transcriptional regulator [Phycisphaerae bacterium]|nr:MerR family transcriptional regulator [Phycisphaerae bacterium]